MRLSYRLFATAGMFGLIASPAFAVPALSYDQTLASPGWFDGTGNPNGGFTVATDNGVLLAMRAKNRFDPNVVHTSSNVYTLYTGAGTNPLLALWNFEYDINVDPTSSSGLTLGAVTATLSISVNSVLAGTLNPMAVAAGAGQITDDSLWNGAKTSGVASYATAWIAQNSENLGFFGNGFDPNQPAVYDITLTVSGQTGVLDSLTIEVNAVPEPASAALLAMGALGLGALRRRAKNTTIARNLD